MNLDELRAVQDREREKDSLQHLRDSFYEEVGTYIADLRAERERRAERADDPFSDPEVRRLTDEIETAEEVAESLYERRMGKVVKTASLAAAGYTTDTEGLTGEEAELFDDLVERIEANQETVLQVLSGRTAGGRELPAAESSAERSTAIDAASDPATVDDAPTAAGGDASAPDAGPTTDEPAVGGESDERPLEEVPTPTDPVEQSTTSDDARAGEADRSGSEQDATDDGSDRPTAEAAAIAGDADSPTATTDAATGERPDAPEGATADADQRSDAADGFDAAAAMGQIERVTVQITDDLGEIVGVDGTAYDLATDDVVTLPEENAEPLVEKDAARRVD